MITSDSEFYISEDKLSTHYFLFDKPFYGDTYDVSRWFICQKCKLEMQVTELSFETYECNMNLTCDEVIIKEIIE